MLDRCICVVSLYQGRTYSAKGEKGTQHLAHKIQTRTKNCNNTTQRYYKGHISINSITLLGVACRLLPWSTLVVCTHGVKGPRVKSSGTTVIGTRACDHLQRSE